MSSPTTAIAPEEKSGGKRRWRLLAIVGALVVGWFVAAEVVTTSWYSAHESKLARNALPASGEIVLDRLKAFAARNGSTGKDQDIGPTAMEMLKCSYGKTLIWSGASGPTAATVLKWDENSVVGGVEAMHNPGVCLRGAGWDIGRQTALGLQRFGGTFSNVTEWEVSRNGLDMRAFSAVFRRYAEAEEGTKGQFWNSQRLKSVMAGRRDAPVMILLAYLPIGRGSADVQARFRDLMNAAFPADAERR